MSKVKKKTKKVRSVTLTEVEFSKMAIAVLESGQVIRDQNGEDCLVSVIAAEKVVNRLLKTKLAKFLF